MNVSIVTLLCLSLTNRVKVTFVQVDDPYSPERESLLQKESIDTAPGQNDTPAQEGEEGQEGLEGGASPGSTIEPDSILERVNSFLRQERALDAYQGSSGKRSRGFLERALLSDSPGWHTPATDVTVNTPASVGISASRDEASGKPADAKVIVSHMLRHFKEGPGQW